MNYLKKSGFMNKKQDKKLSYLQTTSEYFLITGNDKKCPKLIREMKIEFNSILRGINNRTKTESFKEEDCLMFTIRIDTIIETLGELSLNANKTELEYIDILKDKTWYMLETLEQYCKKNYKISIW